MGECIFLKQFNGAMCAGFKFKLGVEAMPTGATSFAQLECELIGNSLFIRFSFLARFVIFRQWLLKPHHNQCPFKQ